MMEWCAILREEVVPVDLVELEHILKVHLESLEPVRGKVDLKYQFGVVVAAVCHTRISLSAVR